MLQPSGEPDRSVHVDSIQPRSGINVVVAIILLALTLAIGFFYLVNAREKHEQSDAVINAAESVDRAAQSVGDAAKDAAEKMKDGK